MHVLFLLVDLIELGWWELQHKESSKSASRFVQRFSSHSQDFKDEVLGTWLVGPVGRYRCYLLPMQALVTGATVTKHRVWMKTAVEGSLI